MNVRIILKQRSQIVREITGQVLQEGDLTKLSEDFWRGCSAPWGRSELCIEKL